MYNMYKDIHNTNNNTNKNVLYGNVIIYYDCSML